MIQNQMLRKFNQGDLILKEGQQSEGLFLIRKGRVEIYRGEGDHQVKLGIAVQGQFLGEMSILLNSPCFATARCLDEVEAVQFERSLCEENLRNAPNWLVSLARGLAARLDLTNHRLELQKTKPDVDQFATRAIELEWES